jgi:hypothetical protein
MKANPDYKWHNPEKTLGCQKTALALSKPTNAKVMRTDMNLLPEGSITPGKLAGIVKYFYYSCLKCQTFCDNNYLKLSLQPYLILYVLA